QEIQKLHPHAKALAIYKSVLYLLQNTKTTPDNYLIISDSPSSITGIQNITHPSGISKLIHDKTIEARDMGIDICYVDLESSNAATSNLTPIFNTYTYEEKKTNNSNSKPPMAQIIDKAEYQHNPGLKKKDETIINRAGIHHTQPSHVKQRSSILYETCGVAYTVKHIITECLKYEDSRNSKYVKVQISMRNIFEL
ncbi:RNase H domain-containing protein, partial [Aphis craccivora]